MKKEKETINEGLIIVRISFLNQLWTIILEKVIIMK